MKNRNYWIGIERGWEVLGKKLGDSLISLPPTQLATHAHILGATGSGKTTLIHHLIAQDIALKHSFVILDLRGDLVNAAIELCQGQVPASRVKIIDLRERNKPFGFNPLAGAGEPYFRALGVLDAVAHQSESWGVQLAETLRNALMLLGAAGEPLTRIELLFTHDAYRKYCLAEAWREHSVQAFWSQYEALSADKRRALAMPVLNKVSLLLATNTQRRILGHSSPINLGKHLATPGSVLLVSLAADELHGAGRMMGNMILAAINREIFAQVNVSESSRNPVRLYVDEFENFEMELFESLLSEGRRYKCPLVLSHQTLAQLTPKIRSIILGIVGTKVAFRLGRDDSHAMSRDLFGSPSAYDFTTLNPGEAILWRRSTEAIELEVNEPLFRNAGSLSAAGRAYLNEIYAYAGDSSLQILPDFLDEEDDDDEDDCLPSGFAGKPTPPLLPARSRNSDLEAWL